MDKLYTIINTKYTKDIGKTFVNLHIIPDELLILYLDNSPRNKLVRIHGYRRDNSIECNYYGTVDNPTCGTTSVISIWTSISDIKYNYVSFPLAGIKHELDCLKIPKSACFTVSNNPAQGYYDSNLRQFVFPDKPTNSKPDYSLIFEDDYPAESPCCGKNGICSIESNKPALYNLDDVTSIPYCNTTIIEHFTMDDEEDGGCPCNKKNKGYAMLTSSPAYNEGLVFFNKNKLCIYLGALILLVLVLSFLCFYRFSRFKKIKF
jgi:hypothetical protein